MRYHHLLHVLFALFAITFAVIDSSTLNDDMLFSDGPVTLPFDDGDNDLLTSASSSPIENLLSSSSPVDQNLFSEDLAAGTNTFASLSSNPSDDFLFGSSLDDAGAGMDNTFELAGCSTLGNSPNSRRLKRQNSPVMCNKDFTNDATERGRAFREQMGSAIGDENPLRDMVKLLEGFQDRQNPFCYMLTRGAFPYGICSSGNANDETPVSVPIERINGNYVAFMLTLRNGYPSNFSLISICPIFWKI